MAARGAGWLPGVLVAAGLAGVVLASGPAAGQQPSSTGLDVDQAIPVGPAASLASAAAGAGEACAPCGQTVEVAAWDVAGALGDDWLVAEVPVGTGATWSEFSPAGAAGGLLHEWSSGATTVPGLAERLLAGDAHAGALPPGAPRTGSTTLRVGPPAVVRDVADERVALGVPAPVAPLADLLAPGGPLVPAEDPALRVRTPRVPVPATELPRAAESPVLAPPAVPELGSPRSAPALGRPAETASAARLQDALAETPVAGGPSPLAPNAATAPAGALDAPPPALLPPAAAALLPASSPREEDALGVRAAMQRVAAAALAAGIAAGPLWVLYRRVRREHALRQPVRRDLFDRVGREPGITPGRLSAATGLHYTTCLHHVRVLEDLGFLVVRRLDGRLRCFAPSPRLGAREARLLAARRSAPARAILDAVAGRPGCSAAEAARAAGATRSAAHFHVQRLLAWGLIEGRREGARWRLFPTGAARTEAAPSPDLRVPSPG